MVVNFGCNVGVEYQREQRGLMRVWSQREGICPIFPQFLDCLIQLIRVYPNYFEFTVDLPRYLWILSFDSQNTFMEIVISIGGTHHIS